MKTNKPLIILLVITVLAACGKTDKEKAEEYLKRAELMAETGNTEEALKLTDSIDVLFPMEVAVRRSADTIEWKIEFEKLETILPATEDSLQTVQELLPQLTKLFRFKKDDKYQDVGTFEHRLLQTENNVNRCYLKPATDEHGNLMLTSCYIGKKSKHNKLRITAGDDFYTETTEAKDTEIVRFEDEEYFREIIVWKGEDVKNLFLFIKDNRDKKIKVTLTGENNNKYIYHLTNAEKEAFSLTYDLSEALSDMRQLTDIQLKITQKIEYLKTKLAL